MKFLPTPARFSMLVAALGLAGCAAGGPGDGAGGATSGPAAADPAARPSAGAGPDVRTVQSRDGGFNGELVGNPAPGSKFSSLQIGMEMIEVQRLIGIADQQHSHETGKRWIPFYYGNDVRRVQMLYAGEGCLSFTAGNQFGGGGNELIRIEADPSGACYQP